MECTGCGLQRATLLFFQGKFAEAFYMYPAIYSLGFLLLFLVFNLFYKFKFDYQLKMGLIIFNAVLIAGAYIYKMFHLFN